MPSPHPGEFARRVIRKATSILRTTPPKPSETATPALDLREDPIGPERPLPDVQYVYLVGGLPRHFAGRTASILTKTRLFYEKYGTESVIVTATPSAELDDLSHHWRERGALAPGVRLASLLDYYPDATVHEGPPIEYPLEEPGLRWIKEVDQPVYRFFDERGVYRLWKRYDYAGRMILRDTWNENRIRISREEFRIDGTLRRISYVDPVNNYPRQSIYYAHDGTPQLNHWSMLNSNGVNLDTFRVVYFDESGQPVRNPVDPNAWTPVLHTCLDELIGDRPTFLTNEDRFIDDIVLSYRRANVKKVLVLHNAHINPPYADIHSIRPSYQPFLSREKDSDAVVFLTRTQRAEAEAHVGRRDTFRVVPHPARTPQLKPGIERDRKLAIMMSRLDPQKQLNHAISAFAEVLRTVPDARLEIYGMGPLVEPTLQAQIDRLGVADSVKLMGYTRDPAAAYQRAGMSLLTSRFEGAPLTLQESLMHGCPVISYDLRYGPADILSDGENGFLVKYGDIKAMAAKIVEVMQDPALHRRLVDASALSAEDFTEPVFLRRWSTLFHELADAGWNGPDGRADAGEAND